MTSGFLKNISLAVEFKIPSSWLSHNAVYCLAPRGLQYPFWAITTTYGEKIDCRNRTVSNSVKHDTFWTSPFTGNASEVPGRPLPGRPQHPAGEATTSREVFLRFPGRAGGQTRNHGPRHAAHLEDKQVPRQQEDGLNICWVELRRALGFSWVYCEVILPTQKSTHPHSGYNSSNAGICFFFFFCNTLFAAHASTAFCFSACHICAKVLCAPWDIYQPNISVCMRGFFFVQITS